MLLEYVKNNPGSTSYRIAKEMPFSQTTTMHHLNKMEHKYIRSEEDIDVAHRSIKWFIMDGVDV